MLERTGSSPSGNDIVPPFHSAEKGDRFRWQGSRGAGSWGAWRVRHKSPQRELGDCDGAQNLVTARLKRGRRRGGFHSRSPRARARGFYGGEGGVARDNRAGLASKRRGGSQSCRAGRVRPVVRPDVRHKSPQRELGDCDGAHNEAQPGLREVGGGVAFIPAVPGLAPGAFMGAREGLPVLSSRPRKQAQAGCRSAACVE